MTLQGGQHFQIKFTRQRWPSAGVIPRIAGATDEAVMDALEFLAEHANERAPKDRGDLIGSTQMEVENGRGYLWYDSVYARRLHEHPEYQFQNGREGKWLVRTIEDMARVIPVQLAPALRRAMAGGLGSAGQSIFEGGEAMARRVLAEARKYQS